jgi:hypothetical protein
MHCPALAVQLKLRHDILKGILRHAKVAHTSTPTKPLSHDAKTFGSSKTTRLPEWCHSQAITMWVLS